MKRTICAVTLCALLLCGCGAPAADSSAASSAGESDMLIVTESYAEEGSYTDSLDNSWRYSYYVPRLPADTEGARAINDAIDEKFGQPVREALSEMAEGISLSCVTTAWKSYRCGDIVSIVVWAEADWEFTDYGVYLYNIATGEQLSTAALLDMLGVAQEDFLTALRRSAVQAFDAQGIIGAARSGNAFMQERSWTASAENIAVDVMAYVTEDGTLRAVLPIGTPAGAGWYYQTLTPELNGADGETVFTAGDYTLTWASGAETMVLLHRGDNWSGAVRGAWSVYIDAAYVPAASEGDSEFLVLLTESGQLEYIDITRGLAGGTLCFMPLGGVSDAVSLETAAENDAPCAVTSDNRWLELAPLLAREGTAPEVLAGTLHMALPQSASGQDCWLTLADSGDMTWQEGMLNSPNSRYYTGIARCLGMTEEGMVLYYDLTGSDADGEPVLRGTFAALCGWEGVKLMHLGGTPLLHDVSGYIRTDSPAG